jgi:membrane-associated PAP2 superfamily phosphatase
MMGKAGLIVVLGVAAIVGVVFAMAPQLELRVAHHFYENIDSAHNVFAWRFNPPLMLARDIGIWIGTALIAPFVAALVIKLILPRRRLLISGRAILFLLVTMALGPGLLVNVLLKDHWGRPRPVDLVEFGGAQHYVAWWDPRGDCPKNCAFVSGDVAGAIWTMAPAALVPPPWRALAYGGALALAIGMSVLRVMAGGHFITDVVFAGVFTYLIIWLTYAFIYRSPRTRLTDDDIERGIERISFSVSGFFGGKRRRK